MNRRYVCPDCSTPIPAGEAVIRSVLLQPVALCAPCADARGWERLERWGA